MKTEETYRKSLTKTEVVIKKSLTRDYNTIIFEDHLGSTQGLGLSKEDLASLRDFLSSYLEDF